MKKYLFIVLGVIGAGLVGYSLTAGWAGLYFKWADRTELIPGFEFIHGKIAAICGLLAFVLLFIRPKIGILPALVTVGVALMLRLMPPVIEGEQYLPKSGIFIAIAGGVVLALAGLVAPKKKA